MNKQPKRISGERFTLLPPMWPSKSPPGSEHWPVADEDTRGPIMVQPDRGGKAPARPDEDPGLAEPK